MARGFLSFGELIAGAASMTRGPAGGLAVPVCALLLLVSACGGGESPGGSDGTGTPGASGFDDEAPDRSNIGYVENLLEKEEDGEWTRGEGLVATLQLFAGEAEAADVLREPDLLVAEGTGIIKMANEYLCDGQDAEAKAEITRLLGLLVFSNEQLEGMAGLSAPLVADAGGLALRLSREPADDCTLFFHHYKVPDGIGKCLNESSVTINGNLYRVFSPAPPLPAGGWDLGEFGDVQLVLEAVADTIETYNGLAQLTAKKGKMPPANLILSVAPGGGNLASSAPSEGQPCGVAIFTSLQKKEVGDFKQVIAHELAHCFQQEFFTEQNQVDYDFVAWREEGLADYMANLVYPDNNEEWHSLIALEAGELKSTLMDRSYTNFIWFQHLANATGNDGMFKVIEALPVSGGRGEQEAALANARSDMSDLFHRFAEMMTDETIVDTSGANIPFNAHSFDVSISGPASPLLQRQLKPFAVFRTQLQMRDEEEEASLEYNPAGLLVGAAKPGGAADWGAIPGRLPSSEGECGLTIVVTSVEPATEFTLDVPSVGGSSGAGCDRCLLGGWTLNNADWAAMLSADPTLDWAVSGELTAVFEPGGRVTWAFSDWLQDPGDGGVLAGGGGSQSYSTLRGGVLFFSGPEITVTATSAGQSYPAYLDTGLGDGQTSYAYECEGDRLVIIKTGLHSGDVEIGWTRVS